MSKWTPETIAGLSISEVKTLRDNAAKRSRDDIVAICDANLSERMLTRAKSPGMRGSRAFNQRQSVTEFHFVCAKGQGVTRERDGSVWTGTWVVSKAKAEKAAKNGAYVALHESKAEPSYLQGVVVGWRIAPREGAYAEGRPAKTEKGIDFHLQLTDGSMSWVGDGAGEKGYGYRETVQEE